MKKTHVFIIGGGASGMMAGIIAKRNGALVTILERNPRIGKKILATGNGRCNYTNVDTIGSDYNNPTFVKYGLENFGPEETINFYKGLGIVPKVEQRGRVYPLSEQASSIVDVLLYEIERLNIEVVSNAFVYRIIHKRNQFEIFLEDNRSFFADKVILATGGKSMPRSGSDGFGYTLLKQLGHSITEVFPSIVKLKLESPYLNHLAGIKMPTQVDLICEEKVIQSEYNDIIFGNYGISGPAILDISRKALELFHSNKKTYIRLTLVTAISKEEVTKRFNQFKSKPVDKSLIGLIHKRYISAIIKEAKIEKQNTLIKDLSTNQINRLIDLLFDWRFLITGSKSFHDAQATAGGCKLDEINSDSMESKLIPGLYIIGELTDIDGRCGGFNLQWAWSSGFLAGYHASTGLTYVSNK